MAQSLVITENTRKATKPLPIPLPAFSLGELILLYNIHLIERTRGLAHRAHLDQNQALLQFCLKLEKACIDSVEIDHVMTKDLALSIHGNKLKRADYVNTKEFIENVELRMRK